MLNKEKIMGRFFQILLVMLALILMYLGGLKFFIISFVFFALGGMFEEINMRYFYSKPKKKISRKDKINAKLKNAFLWVHSNIEFLRKYNTTIYEFKKTGITLIIFSYLIMLLYVLIGYFLLKQFSYYGLIIYLIPIISNIYSFSKNNYLILSK